ncbi:TetR/AcrR family transcriptional regulator [Lacticaseibacillus absianus]|uniref:TetR/AcrR family transcriptional regulator n=1 Tax=Lacticaseibacillus absianus TaxID=2729623 RepID=UPI0015CD480F|nr:TetR/AcrR family transcriptional regulator [Lacticaseibacillus absianus]
MVSTTFDHLAPQKQARIRQALLDEFSQHPLATAQVARIVAQAGIARGAFYKYFDDLTDAYRYVFGLAMQDIHAGLPQPDGHEAAAYLAATRAFLTGVRESPYRALIRQHFRANADRLHNGPSRLGPSPTAWAATTLCHQTIRDVLLEPDTATARLAQLATALDQMEG